MNLRNAARGLVVAALASMLVYAVMLVLSDGPEVLAALRGFSAVTLGWMFVLATGGFVVRGLRWGRLMRVVGHPVSRRDALYMHLAGQTMSISPGRVGEILKPWLARDIAGMPMKRGVPLVFSERVADLIAVCILSLGGLSVIGGGPWGLVTATVGVVVGTWLAGSSWFHGVAMRTIAKQSWASRYRSSTDSISEAIQLTLGWRALWWSVASSVLAWGLEGIAFSLCIQELGFDALSTMTAVSVYAVATIVGALTFLPGGIGLTEASMTGLLVAAGMGVSDATVATLLIRLVTMWWGVLLGWIVLWSRPSVIRKMTSVAMPEPESDASRGALG